jgi:microcystin-dependent protein
MAWTVPTLYTPGAPATPPCTSTDWINFFTNNLTALMPVGAYLYWHQAPTESTNLINGCYLECNGQAVSRTTYSALFAVIGTTYGAGDGSTTFNLPDAGGRFLPGTSGTGGHADVNALGDNDGGAAANRAARHLHTVAETAHGHTATSGTSVAAGLTHTHDALTYEVSTGTGADDPGTHNVLDGVGSQTTGSQTHLHAITGMTPGTTTGAVTVSPGGAQPNDSPAFICAGTLYIKAI